MQSSLSKKFLLSSALVCGTLSAPTGWASQSQDDVFIETLNPDQGFKITHQGGLAYEGSFSVSQAGDFNQDGVDDVILGGVVPFVNNTFELPSTYNHTRVESFIIYGRQGEYSEGLDLSTLSPSQGVRIQADQKEQGSLGFSVSRARDFNGDGVDDVMLGDPYDSSLAQKAGSVYVIYGRAGGYPDFIDLGNFSMTTGVKIEGSLPYQNFGFSLSSAGDFNGGMGCMISSLVPPALRIEQQQTKIPPM